jgi:tetratricopeptide (TPR) repeat protein
MAEKGKEKKKKFELPTEMEKMSPEEANREMEKFFTELEEHLKEVPEEEIKAGAEKVMDFIKGELSWGELFDLSPELLFQMAEYGMTQFKVGRYDDAERVFKVLTVLDWENSYYHSVMGSILQRQKRYGEAIVEYGEAIELNPYDITSLTNRGEIFMLHGLAEDAKADFKKAVELDPEGEDKWANRARMLLLEMERQRMEKEKKEEKKEGKKPKRAGKKKH